jgi:hypothetical protein
MKLNDFEIGAEFWIWTGLKGDAEWRRCICTDKGMRTIVYQRIEPITIGWSDAKLGRFSQTTYTVEEAMARGEFSPAMWDTHVDYLLNDYEFSTCAPSPDDDAMDDPRV